MKIETKFEIGDIVYSCEHPWDAYCSSVVARIYVEIIGEHGTMISYGVQNSTHDVKHAEETLGRTHAEAIGPKIQGNPLGWSKHDCYIFSARPNVFLLPLPTFESLQQLLFRVKSSLNPDRLAEGIVWHHPDGRMAKIKRRDF